MPQDDLEEEGEWRTPGLIHKMLAVDPFKTKQTEQNKTKLETYLQLCPAGKISSTKRDFGFVNQDKHWCFC